MTVSARSSSPPKEAPADSSAEPLVQSVRTYLASEPHKLVVKVLLQPEPEPQLSDVQIISDAAYLENSSENAKSELNNNSNNKFAAHKNTEKDSTETTGPVDANRMPTAAERMQRQPLLARCVKQESRVVLPLDESELEDGASRSPHQQPNGDFQLDIPGREDRYPKEIWKTALSCVFLGLCVVINMVSLSIVHERVPDRERYAPLPDVFLDNVAPLDWALSASEILIMFTTSTSTAIIVFHKHRFIVARRVFLLVGLGYLYRSATIFVTVLPVSSTTYYCSPKLNHTTPLIIIKRVVSLISGFGLTINGKHTYCGDAIYSGHTMILVLSYLVISEYSPRRVLALHWAAGIAAVAGVLLLLLAHAHYVIDVILAYYITTRLFWTYHTLANRSPRQGPQLMISREWWFVIFNYFEKNVDGPVPRHYNWPLPWPKAKLFSRLS